MLGIYQDDLYDNIRKTLPVGGGDTKMRTIVEFCTTLDLKCVSLKSVYTGEKSLWQLPGGPMLHTLRFTEGVFIINLRIYVGPRRFDNHSISYNASTGMLVDNIPNILWIESGDTESKSDVYQIFKYLFHLFPTATSIHVSDVYEILQI